MNGSRLKSAAFLTILAVIFFTAVLCIHHDVFLGLPYLTDDQAYLFQARTFAMGKLYVPSPEGRDFFDSIWMINDGRYYSKYFPGHPALLMFGIHLGYDHLIPIVFMTASIFLLYGVGLMLYETRTALIACSIFAFSPSALLTTGTYLSQTSSVFLTLLFVFLMLRSEFAGRRFFAAGMATYALLILTRPYTALALLIPCFLLAAYGSRNAGLSMTRLASVLLSSIALGGGLMLCYNWILAGDAFEFPYFMAGERTFDRPGFFVPSVESPHGFSVMEASYNLAECIVTHGKWGLGHVLLFLFAAIRLFIAPSRIAWICLSPLMALMVFHFPYHTQTGADPLYGWGPLYYLEAVPFTALTAASGLYEVYKTIKTAAPRWSHLYGAIICCFLVGLTSTQLAERMRNTARVQRIQKSVHFLIQGQGLHHAVVFVKSGPHPWNSSGTWPGIYFVDHSPTFDDDVLMAIDRGYENARLRVLYPRRKAYSIEYDSEKQALFLKNE